MGVLYSLVESRAIMSAVPLPAKLRSLLLHLHPRKRMSYEQNGLGTDPADLFFFSTHNFFFELFKSVFHQPKKTGDII